MIVELTEQPQLIPYTVEDLDGQKSTAIIWVPGVGQQVPTLAKDEVIEVVAGQSVTVDLNEWVKVRDGRSPRLTQTDRIKLIGADGSDPVAGNGTALKYTAGQDYVGPGFAQLRGHRRLRPGRSRRPEIDPQHPHQGPARTPTGTTRRCCWAASWTCPRADSATTDLARLTSDPDDGDVGPDEVRTGGRRARQASTRALTGRTLKASAKDGADAGTSGAVQVKAKDPRGLEATATYQLTVTASNRPKPVANDDVEPNAAAGKPVTVQVLANDANPFPETALKIVSAVTETGQGSAVAVRRLRNRDPGRPVSRAP